LLLVDAWYSFFFQAEDGIRDFHVTGVQTCALPIYDRNPSCWFACILCKAGWFASRVSVLRHKLTKFVTHGPDRVRQCCLLPAGHSARWGFLMLAVWGWGGHLSVTGKTSQPLTGWQFYIC